MRTPLTAKLEATDLFVSRLDQDLAESQRLRSEALALMMDNDWCRRSLAHRGIEVPVPVG